MGMTNVYWRRANSLAVTSLACRKLGDPSVQLPLRRAAGYCIKRFCSVQEKTAARPGYGDEDYGTELAWQSERR